VLPSSHFPPRHCEEGAARRGNPRCRRQRTSNNPRRRCYAQPRFILLREYSIGKRLVEGYLYQPCSWFLSRYSADLGKKILESYHLVV
jgi:hypothetical protein